MAETPSHPLFENEENSYLFGLNVPVFSDSVLHLQIIPDDHSNSFDSGGKKVSNLTTLLVNSVILARNSPFFFEIIVNGRRDSQDRNIVFLTIKQSEEASLMELVKVMYGSSLISTLEQRDLVNLLLIADKFEVISCVGKCVDRLIKLPMSEESARVYLELPSSVLVKDVVKPLVDASKQCLKLR